jgi:2-amino-4-hydroxy-6-hydroxymethyldihydropteridine diphosphokinase
MGPVVGYIGLGSNLGDRAGHLRAGVEGLRGGGLQLLGASSVWETEPVEAPAPHWFLNMAVAVRGFAEPLAWLDLLERVERLAGRRRGAPNAPRTLDLDLLLLGSLVCRGDRLTLPHPRMWDRRFVLEPLAEIAAGVTDPVSGRTVQDRLRDLRDASAVRRVGPFEGPGIIPALPGSQPRGTRPQPGHRRS